MNEFVHSPYCRNCGERMLGFFRVAYHWCCNACHEESLKGTDLEEYLQGEAKDASYMAGYQAGINDERARWMGYYGECWVCKASLTEGKYPEPPTCFDTCYAGDGEIWDWQDWCDGHPHPLRESDR